MYELIELCIRQNLQMDCRYEEQVICLQAEVISRFSFAS